LYQGIDALHNLDPDVSSCKHLKELLRLGLDTVLKQSLVWGKNSNLILSTYYIINDLILLITFVYGPNDYLWRIEI